MGRATMRGIGVGICLMALSIAIASAAEPDVTRFRPLPRWPDGRDLARLKSVEGKSRNYALRVLGHPSAVTRWADGTEEWNYAWVATCRLRFERGRCVDTFYTGGY